MLARHHAAQEFHRPGSNVAIGLRLELPTEDGGQFSLRLDNERSDRRVVATFGFREPTFEFVSYDITPRALSIERLEISKRVGVEQKPSIDLPEARDVLERLRTIADQERMRGKL